ncbi:MAG: hypothetical protein JSS20_12025 [Proteobacteria bacterium]|nr:hypothetical protein [Pseudomonadota bacterium]
MKPTRGAHPLWKSPDDFAETHCQNCKAGWTRQAANGALTVCLLDQEPVMQGMTNCDRFEQREPKPLRPEVSMPETGSS